MQPFGANGLELSKKAMSYNIGTIRKLIRSSLLESDLEPLCEDHFSEISDDVGSEGLTFSKRIDILVDYVKKSDGRIERLLAAIKAINPDKYGVFEQDLRKLDEPEEFQRTKKIPPPHLPYLCDRSFQEKDLEKAFDIHRENEQKRKYPLLCIIHGEETECHDSFIERISRADVLQELYKPKEKIEQVDLKELEFPLTKGGRRRFLEALHEELDRDVKKYFSSTANVSHPLVIYYFIDNKEWRLGGGELIEKFISFWRQREVAGERIQLVCLCIKYRPSGILNLRNWWNKRSCRSYLEKLDFSNSTNLHGVLLTELQAVQKSDAEKWARSEEVQKWWNESRQELENKVGEIYVRYCSTRRWKQNDECVPMDKLAQELKQLLLKQQNNF